MNTCISASCFLPQVQKHMDMLRRERETAALVAVRDAFPDLGAAVCIVALEVRRMF